MKIWLSSKKEKQSFYPWRMIAGIVGIVALMLLLIVGGMVLSFWLHWSNKVTALILCLVATALAVWLALRLGRRSVRDTLVFWLEDDRLFALDLRQLVPYHRGFLGYASSAFQVGEQMKRIAKMSSKQLSALPGAVEILDVERMKQAAHHTALHCRVQNLQGHTYRRTFLLVKGYEDEDLLFQQLERRQRETYGAEIQENHNPYRMLVSLVVFLLMVALCVLSHPAVGKLPQGIYFPCLGLSLIPLFCLIYYGIKQRRGE